MKTIGHWMIWVLLLVAIGLGVASMLWTQHQSKVAYIELVKVFNGFEMTLQYKQKLESVVMSRKSIADSLELELKARSRTLGRSAKAVSKDMENFEYDRQLYIEKARQFQEDNLALKQKYDGEINKQLNQYVKEYGEKHGYRFIYGADGSGVLMYASERDNISDEVLLYINERYKGNAK